MKTAVIQFGATENKQDNLNRAVDFVVEAAEKKAAFILLPEVFIYRGSTSSKKKMDDVSERLTGPTVSIFRAVAKQNKANILLGSIYEKVTGSSKLYNTSVLIDQQGNIAAKYRKMNLFQAQLGKNAFREKDVFLKGRRISSAKIGGFNTGLSVCYDLRFPELYQKYRQKGADIVTVPSNFTKKTGRAHWNVLVRARAVEQLCYVLAPNQVGTDSRGSTSFGHSLIVSPWGEVLAEASGHREEIIYADVLRKEITKARKMLPGIVLKSGSTPE